MIQHIQTLAEQTGEVWQKLNDNPDKVYFPNFGDGDNVLKSGIDIDRVMFTIPGTNFKIYWYGFLIALGIILATIYGFKKMKKAGVDPDRATDAVIGGFFGAIIGARLYYIAFSSNLSIKDFFDFRDGGLAIYGGIIGAILVGGIITRLKKIRLTAMLDIVAPCFFIGQCIGRWGNFFNQEAFGTNTDKPWGMMSLTTANYVSNHITDGSVDPTLPIHPCFLYESLWCLLGFILLHFYFKHRKFDGEVILGYAALYGLGRFFIEGLRTDSLYIGNVRVSQLLAGLCFVASVIAIIVVRIIIAKNKDYVFFKDTELSREQILQYENAKRFEKERKEFKAKIASAKANGEDAAELEKEYEEQFGEIAKKRQAEALVKAEENDIKAAAERKAARTKSKVSDDNEVENQAATTAQSKNDDVETESIETAASNVVEKVEETKTEVIEPAQEKTEEIKTETVEPAQEKSEETKTETVEPAQEKSEETKTETVEPVQEKSEETKIETVEPAQEKSEETKTETVEPAQEKSEETKTETDKPAQEKSEGTKQGSKNDNKPKQNNSNRNRNNRNKNRNKNRNNNNPNRNNSSRPNNKQGGGNKKNSNKRNNKPKGENN